jgi:hypothetical protein
MRRCECTTTQHENHPGKTCDNSATSLNAYCNECKDKAAKERADTKPDLRAYQQR